MNEDFIQITMEEPRQAGIQNVEWEPLPEGVLKINIDAAFKNQSIVAKVGVVGRDSTGSVHLVLMVRE
ncbi:hypothetical protein CRYUN_Cryun41cG0022000 [Craigia yunnanensis]